jgi:hypothetical protein
MTYMREIKSASDSFTEQELYRWCELLKVHQTFNSSKNGNISGEDWEFLVAEFYGVECRKHKLLFDVVSENVGFSAKTMNLKTKDVVTTVIRRADVPRVDLKDSYRLAYNDVLEHFERSCQSQNVDTPKIIILVRKTDCDFILWQDNYILPKPEDVVWKVNSRGSFTGFVNKIAWFTWSYDGGSQFSQRFYIPRNAYNLHIDYKPLTFSEKLEIIRVRK